jgi:hypothetical protein
MQRRVLVAGAAGVLVGAAAAAAVAQDELFHGFGLWPSHESREKFQLELGVTATGRPGWPKWQGEDRTVLLVPAHYGDLFQVTQNGPDSVLWYRSSSGQLRNAVLTDAATTPWIVERTRSLDLEIKLR